MRSRLIRPLLVFEFLVAVGVWLTFWSQVGGQYHLDLMFWPWKFGLTVAAAWLITAITAELFQSGGTVSRRLIVYAALLFAAMVTAGVVTYYYHMNEPADEDNGDAPAELTGLLPLKVLTVAQSRSGILLQGADAAWLHRNLRAGRTETAMHAAKQHFPS
jgi:hypothetical protein